MTSSPIPNPAEFAGESGRTPAVTTRRIDVLTQRVTKLESQAKEDHNLIVLLMERITELEQTKTSVGNDLFEFVMALTERVTELEKRPAGPAVKHFKDQLFDDIKAFMLGHPGIKVNQAMVAANVGAGIEENGRVHTRLQRLVKEQVIQTDKIVGRERTYWAPLPKK